MTYEPTGYACIDHLDIIPEGQRGCLYMRAMYGNGISVRDALLLAPRLGLCDPDGARFADCGETGKELEKYAPVTFCDCREALKAALGEEEPAGILCGACGAMRRPSLKRLEETVLSGIYQGIIPCDSEILSLLTYRTAVASDEGILINCSVFLYRELARKTWSLWEKGKLSENNDSEADIPLIVEAASESVRVYRRKKSLPPLTDTLRKELSGILIKGLSSALLSRSGPEDIAEAVNQLKAYKNTKLRQYRNPDLTAELAGLLSKYANSGPDDGMTAFTDDSGNVTDEEETENGITDENRDTSYMRDAFNADPSLGIFLSGEDMRLTVFLTAERYLDYQELVLGKCETVHAEHAFYGDIPGVLLFGQPEGCGAVRPAFLPLSTAGDAFWEWLLTEPSHDVLTMNLCLLLRDSGKYRNVQTRTVFSLSALLHLCRNSEDVYPVGEFGETDGSSFIRSCFLRYVQVCASCMSGLTESGMRRLRQFMNYERILAGADSLREVSSATYDNLTRVTFAKSLFVFDKTGIGIRFSSAGTLVSCRVSPPVKDAGEHGSPHENFHVMLLHYLSQKTVMLHVRWMLVSAGPSGLCLYVQSRSPETVSLVKEAVSTAYADMVTRVRSFSLPPLRLSFDDGPRTLFSEKTGS